MIPRRRRFNSGSSEQDTQSGFYPQEYNYQQPSRTYVNEINNSTRQSPPYKALIPDKNNMHKDRTDEFLSITKSMQQRQGNGLNSSKASRAMRQRSEFMMAARKIGKDISNTYEKLEKLTILAKRKSLFDDRPVEIQELTNIIKQDIGSLNKQIAQLQEVVRATRHKNNRHNQNHSNSVVVGLQSKLASMSNSFKSVLEVRTENLKQQKSRRDQFSNSNVSSSMPPDAMKGHTGSILLQDEAQSHGTISMDNAERDRYQQQLLLIEENDTYIQERADNMQMIEHTIVELGDIFTQLATMVKEQEEMVQRIDSNVEDTSLNVEAAHGEILKYFQSVTSNRWLIIKVFGILIFFFIIFVVFMA